MPDVNDPAQGIGSLHERLDRIEHLVTETCMHPAERIHLRVGVPSWKRRTEGEARWQVAVCTAVAIALQIGPRGGKVAPGGTAGRPGADACRVDGMCTCKTARPGRCAVAVPAARWRSTRWPGTQAS
jgi:hypothetical protein